MPGRYPFDLGAMRGFSIARIAGNHPVFVQEVHVA